MSVVSTAAGLSVPMPMVMPASSMSLTGAKPMPSLALMRGQWATATFCWARILMSVSSTWTACTTSMLGTSRMSQL